MGTAGVNRPREPFDDRELTPPADPWATINRPVPTVHLGGPNETVHLGGPKETVHLSGPNETVHPGGPNETANLDETVRQPARSLPTQRAAQRPLPETTPEMAQTVRAQDQMRFGPGVPVPPAATPGWPATAPAAKRPRGRRLVSLLSSLLTLALVLVVGLYLWQRLRPLEVESASVAVPRPAGNRCDVTVDVVATVHTNGRSGVIRYQWFRTDASPGAVLTEQVGRGQRTATLTLKWTFSGVGTTTETATLNITEPSPLQAGTHVAYRCRRG